VEKCGTVDCVIACIIYLMYVFMFLYYCVCVCVRIIYEWSSQVRSVMFAKLLYSYYEIHHDSKTVFENTALRSDYSSLDVYRPFSAFPSFAFPFLPFPFLSLIEIGFTLLYYPIMMMIIIIIIVIIHIYLYHSQISDVC
jgi:hypothetical protein